MDSGPLCLLATFGTRVEAQLVKGSLEEAGIPAMIDADTAGRMREHLAWSGTGFRVFVREEDLESATKILNAPVDWSGIEFPGEERGRVIPWRRFTGGK